MFIGHSADIAMRLQTTASYKICPFLPLQNTNFATGIFVEKFHDNFGQFQEDADGN